MEQPDFTPRPIRFRVWDGERMIEGDDLFYLDSRYPRFMLAPEGVLWRRDADGRTRFAIGHVPLLSTGLTDADGVEVFEGDVVAFNTYHDNDGPETVGPVVWSSENCGFGIDAESRRWHVAAAISFGGRVVGNVFEGVREPA